VRRYAARRAAALVATLFFVSALVFVVVRILPGDPAALIMGTEGSREASDRLRESMGLNRPLPERMAYALTKQGRVRSEEIARASTRYAGPAPVSMTEYRTVLAEAAKPGTLDMVKVNIALAGIELAPGVVLTPEEAARFAERLRRQALELVLHA